MDIGLYNMKYPVRKLISGALPLLKHVDPNAVSWSMLPVGAAIAACLFIGAQGHPILYLAVILLTFLRMYLGTLDGLMAEHYQKSSPRGEMINRLTPELCDVMYVGALTLARPDWMVWGIVVLCVSWMTTFAGLIGLTAQKKIQSVGPVGQTDRLAALLVFTLLAFCADTLGWGIDFIRIFLMWAIIGGVLTVILRLKRNLGN